VTANISGIEAGKDVLRQAEKHIQTEQSFTVETTLSGDTYLKMASRAKDAGFHVVVIFVGTASVEINLERVKERGKKGGHDVPEEDQRRRFPRSMANLQKLVPMADLVMVFNNSTVKGHRLIAYGRVGSMAFDEPVPEWAAFLRG
jgi:predicted ABC-type ATPase